MRQYYLQSMDIVNWQERGSNELNLETVGTCQQSQWSALESAVKTCTKCPLHQGRKNAVFGVGSHTADLLVVGEAPGFNEDRQAEPFVGRAGQLLNKMLQAIQIQRQEVFIANVIKCRPPENRDPQQSEVAQCSNYLNQQIELLQPKVILALGRVAARYLLGVDSSMRELRGRKYTYGEQKIPLLVTYHPAYLLRSPREKAKAYRDLLMLSELDFFP